MSLYDSAFAEGQSTVRPPKFNGTDFAYWKARMKIFLVSSDFDIWKIVANGYHPPMIKVENINVLKPEDKWDDNDNRLFALNGKAMNAIICALDRTEFNRVSNCSTAQEIWNTLEVTHEGTSQVKESRLAILSTEYEEFHMRPTEKIKEMYARFTDIVYNSKALGKTYSSVDLVRKILRALPIIFQPKITAIQEAKDLSKLNIDDLIGNLMSHEMELKTIETREKGEVKAPKTLAFNTEDSDNELDEEQEMLVREFKKHIKTPRGKAEMSHRFTRFIKTLPTNNLYEQNTTKVQCFHCRKYGHYKSNCPLLKDGSLEKKGKSLAVTWDDDDEDEPQEEYAQSSLCLIGESDTNQVHNEFTLPELLNICENMNAEITSLESSVETLKESNFELQQENYNVSQNEQKLNSEIETLKITIDKFKGKSVSSDELPCKNCATLKMDISNGNVKIDSFEKRIETFVKNENNIRKSFIDKSVMLVNENIFLKSRISDLEDCIQKFGVGRNSLNMIIETTDMD